MRQGCAKSGLSGGFSSGGVSLFVCLFVCLRGLLSYACVRACCVYLDVFWVDAVLF